ncbi:MAG: hypothetical protein IIC24_10595, partial [Chloroflexi bacterium]|nr:hypothetical protein [Chloroflexota bacterium]
MKKEYGPDTTFETLKKNRYKYILKPNATNLIFINLSRATINNWRKPCGSEYDKIEGITLSENPFKLFFVDNPAGK